MVKLFTFALVLCAALVFAQRVTHRDPRYLAELSSGGGGGGFSPANTNDLKLWYDLSRGVKLETTNAGVTEIIFWTNSGTLQNVSVTGPDYLSSVVQAPLSWNEKPNYQTNVIGGQPAIWFIAPFTNGGVRYHYMQSSTGLSNAFDGKWTNGEAFIVVKVFRDPAPAGAGQNSNSFWRLNAANMAAPFQHYPWTDGTIYEPFGTSVRKDNIATTVKLTNWIIYNVVTRPGLYQIRQNGNLIYDSAVNTVAWRNDNYVLGASSIAQYQFTGWIAELLCYGNSELSVADRLQTMQYLTNKFGSTNFPSLTL